MLHHEVILLKRRFKKFAREDRNLFLFLKYSGLLHKFGFPEKSPLISGPNCDFIYIRLHRVGGTSIAMALGVDKIHYTSKEAINYVGKQVWDSVYKFACVRNPFAKAVSTFNHFPKNDRFQMKSKPISFEEWIKCTYGNPKDPKYYFSVSFFQSQTDWLKDHDNKISLNKIAKLENIQDDFTEIIKTLGVDVPIPHLNSSKKADYRTYYNNETYDIVKSWHLEDLDNFGYTFDNG